MHCDAAKVLSNYTAQASIEFAPKRDLCKQGNECELDGGIKKCAPCEALGLSTCGENRVCVDLANVNLLDCDACRGNYMNIVKGDPSLLKNCTLEANSFYLDRECKTCSDDLVLLNVETALGSEKICVAPKNDLRYCGAIAGDECVPCKDDSVLRQGPLHNLQCRKKQNRTLQCIKHTTGMHRSKRRQVLRHLQ